MANLRKYGTPWKPWFEGMETPSDLGNYHGTVAKSYAPKPGCVMTKDEYDEYIEAYKFAFHNNRR